MGTGAAVTDDADVPGGAGTDRAAWEAVVAPSPASTTSAAPPSNVIQQASGGIVSETPTSPPTQAPPRPPLRRRSEDRVLGGVAGGLADHLGIDVALVRIILVVLALFNGIGILAYIIAWIAIPARPAGSPAPAPARATGGASGRQPLFWVGVGLLVLGALALVSGPLAGLGVLPPGTARELVIPLVLIGFGLALWRAGEPDTASTTAAPPSASYDPATRMENSMSPSATIPPAPGQPGGAAGPPPAQPGDTGGGDWSPPPAPQRPRSWVTRATLGAAFLAVGLLWTLQLAGLVDLGVGTILAVALLIVGIGLLIGAVVGRARWLILVGALLLPPVLAAQVAPPAFGTVVNWTTEGRGAGEMRVTPSDLDELQDSYQLGIGSVRLDLSELALEGETVTIDVEVGVGEIRVTVPDDVEVAATGSSGIGEVRLLDERSGGIGASEVSATQEPDDPDGRIELDLTTGIGEVRVASVPADR